MRRLFVAALVVAISLIGMPLAAAGPEGSIANRINSARKANGKDPVQVYWDLRDDARAHASAMMKRGEVFPDPNIGSATKGWKALAQIVSVGDTAGNVYDAIMRSRRSIVLGPYNYVGVGVAKDDDGFLWVAIIFMNGPDGLVKSPAPTTTTTVAPAEPSSSSSGGGGGGGRSGAARKPAPVEWTDVFAEAELVVLSEGWIPPDLLRPQGMLR